MMKRRFEEKRPIRLGAMQERTRYEEPSYKRALVTAGLLERTAGLMTAWSAWQGVCRDPEFIKLSMTLAAKKEPVHLVSVAEPFQNGARVLAAMSERQLEALRQRVGAR
jgi:hypothetical protein